MSMASRLAALEQQVRLLNLKITELEFRFTYQGRPEPKPKATRVRTYDLWLRIKTLHDNGMSMRNLSQVLDISYSTVRNYLHIPEEEARKLPRTHSVHVGNFKRFKLEAYIGEHND